MFRSLFLSFFMFISCPVSFCYSSFIKWRTIIISLTLIVVGRINYGTSDFDERHLTAFW